MSHSGTARHPASSLDLLYALAPPFPGPWPSFHPPSRFLAPNPPAIGSSLCALLLAAARVPGSLFVRPVRTCQPASQPDTPAVLIIPPHMHGCETCLASLASQPNPACDVTISRAQPFLCVCVMYVRWLDETAWFGCSGCLFDLARR